MILFHVFNCIFHFFIVKIQIYGYIVNHEKNVDSKAGKKTAQLSLFMVLSVYGTSERDSYGNEWPSSETLADFPIC